MIRSLWARAHAKYKGAQPLALDEGSAAIVITSDTPDEARLALLDLDVTAEELRGKVLRWDEKARAWRPDESGSN